ncbi:23S rRNA (guanosine(2251)-2'-O)-methyltransferase RlmB [Sediminicurvatus halobius]|uniref:23S rRNA (guanosine-2'-O-)-methyltransferase RlmB n=1 Tax=Sediminicurvatus halobius TaxID=2182432 RepID=A0A2U2MX23_9GAMM|nr:23S rRNA (guanosine(2251)-2'-O)-methyltransferase RlmB [Spiribacter halobius]PWG61415.1 23S rRNA (guanosine(2251)-2'-O)-methyltransferase RlmB [Spiribacter halobius]UEX76961.1 23S rRNA (guanosine(2251)-2'-O)-methyltransferase RlmB [Spiribacter halobius]
MSQDDLIHGLHAVQAAVRYEPAGVVEAWVERRRRDGRMQRLRRQLQGLGCPVHEVERRELDRLTGSDAHQGVAIRYRGPPPRGDDELAQLLDGLARAPFLLVLDQVQDPHNLGACLRTAEGAGVDAVITPRDRAAGLTPAVHKVAAGAAETLPLFQVTNLARALRDLRERGIWLVGAADTAAASLYDTDLTGSLALVLGAEENGLRRLTREACDQLVAIPMAGRVESLNVSVAAGVMLYEAVRQRAAAVQRRVQG